MQSCLPSFETSVHLRCESRLVGIVELVSQPWKTVHPFILSQAAKALVCSSFPSTFCC
jgi:hypothetical protein